MEQDQRYKAVFFQSLCEELEEVLYNALRAIMATMELSADERYKFEVVRYPNPRIPRGSRNYGGHFLGSLFELRIDDTEYRRRPIIRLDTSELDLSRPQRRLLCAVLDESIYIIAGGLLRDFARRNFGAQVEWFILPDAVMRRRA